MAKPITEGMRIPKGSVVEIGYHKGIAKSAVGAQVILNRDIIIGTDDRFKNCKVTKQGNWHTHTMTHRLRTSDFIISLANSSNKAASGLLDKEW